MLESIVNLATLIRQTSEGTAWRSAWKNLHNLHPDIPNMIEDENVDWSPEAILSVLCTSESAEARPVMLPFLVARHPVIQNYPDFIKSLSKNPDLLNKYDLLVKQFAFFALVIGYLRSIVPGYPNENLIFNLPNTPWKDLSNIKEVPLGIEKTLVERTKGNLLRGMSSHIPSKSDALIKALLAVSSELQNEGAFLKLDVAAKNISKNKNLTNELIISQKLFEKRWTEISKLQEPNYIRNNRIAELALQIYTKKGGKILDYVNAYLEFEELIEKIYWVLTQFVTREKLCCLSVLNDAQLQQIMLGNSRSPILTGISRTSSSSLAIGQLVYLNLSDVDSQISGLYQINHMQSIFKAGSGIRHYFKAELVWRIGLKALESSLEKCNAKTFLVQNEPITDPDHFRIQISSPDGEPISLEMGDPVLNFSVSKTMFLPF